MESAVSALILVCSATYVLAFNALPDPLRVNLAGIMGLVVFIAAITVILRYLSLKSVLFCVGLGLVLFSAAIDFAFERERLATLFKYFADTLRLVTVLAAIAYFSSVRHNIKPIYFILSCTAVAAVAVAAYVLLGTIMFAGTARPASFTGGWDGVHSSAYVLTWALLCAVILWRQEAIPRWLALALVIPLAALILYNQVRTTWFMTIAFFATIYVARLRNDTSRWMLALGIILILILGVTIYQMVPDASSVLSTFSSGRTTAYGERFGTLAGRTPFELVFGTGAGSDLVVTQVWWWHEGLDSHNSLIHFTFETGLVGLIGVLLMLAGATISANYTQIAVVMSLVAASLVSNGPLERPAFGILFAALLVLGQTTPPIRPGQPSRRSRERG
jgi:hypothetical protein